MKLTNKQRDYLINRLDGRAAAIKAAVVKRETVDAVHLSRKEKVDLIEKGKVKKHKDYLSTSYPTLANIWDFTKLQRKPYLSKKGAATLAKLSKTVQNIRDTIMLGDSETDALALLSKLDTGKW